MEQAIKLVPLPGCHQVLQLDRRAARVNPTHVTVDVGKEAFSRACQYDVPRFWVTEHVGDTGQSSHVQHVVRERFTRIQTPLNFALQAGQRDFSQPAGSRHVSVHRRRGLGGTLSIQLASRIRCGSIPQHALSVNSNAALVTTCTLAEGGLNPSSQSEGSQDDYRKLHQ